MKKVFVALPFSISNYLEEAMRIVHTVEPKLDTYCELIPSIRTPFTYSQAEDFRPIDYLFNSLSYMRDADVVVFLSNWHISKECSLLHDIADAYELNVMVLDENEKPKLAPCPICGKSPSVCRYIDSKCGDRYGLVCKCQSFPKTFFDTKEEAIVAWNRRMNDED